MLEQLLLVIQQNSREAVIENKDIPDDLNEAVQQTLLESIQTGMSSAAESPQNLTALIDLFGKGAGKQSVTGNPITDLIADNFVTNLGKKYGISESISRMIASSVLPMVLSQFAQKTADANDSSIDMNSIMNVVLGGGKSSPGQSSGIDFNQVLQSVAGGKDGQVDLAGLAGQLLGGSTSGEAGSASGAGSLLGTVGKLFKC
jgi:hypothetical protein